MSPLRRPQARIAFVLLGVIVLAALLAPVLTPVGPAFQQDVVGTRFLRPGTIDGYGLLHLLGTDRLGRDVWSRLLYGARVSLAVATLGTAVSLSIGSAIGLVAGVASARVAAVLLGLTDFALALPRVVLLLLLAALWEPSATLVVLILGFTGWMPVARLVYAVTLTQLARPYAQSAAALGGGRRWLLSHHVIPHAATPVASTLALGVGNAVGLEAGLSLLGLGVQPPDASWGTLIASGRDTVVNAPWVGLAPGVALVLVVVGCTLLADAFTDPAGR